MSSKKHRKRKHTARSAQPAEAVLATAGESAATGSAKTSHKVANAVDRVSARAGVPASVARRFFAYLIDWYVGALCSAVPISIVSAQITGDITNQYLVDFPVPWGYIAGAGALLFAAFYYIAVPLVIWPGQTPGKRLCGIQITLADGSPVDLPHLALRQIVGITVIEGVIANASGIWHQMLTIATGINFVHPLMYVGFAITLVSCAMILIRKDHRCLHDFIGGTKVCAAPKRG